MEEKKEQISKTLDWHVLFARKNRFLLIGLAGICLIVLADALWSGSASKENVQETAAKPQPVVSTEQVLEERLTGMIESVQGAGKVRVMVTLENAGETVYATNEKSDTQVSDTSAGITDRRTSYENEHVFFDAQEGRQPLVETRLEPEVKGVAVVCEGGDDVTVIRRITDLVSVVLNLPSNRVCVTKMIDTEEAS